jgi:Tfp pilus assembly protein PilN
MKRPRLELDLIARPRRPRWPGYVLLAASLVGAGAMLERYQDARQALERLDAVTDLVADSRPRERAPRKPLDEKSAQAAARQLGLPWAGLIETLERAATPDVAVLQLQPEAQQRIISISAEARHREAMFRYLRALTQAKGLAHVHLVNEQVQTDDPQTPIRFSVQASFGLMQ